ncbi:MULTISPECIES: AAA family ATPase [Planococcus]|uniref:Endonuclease GajA/Old nuclease/RecF-like AAA domain-containing protein n=1 Tax=Planococcus faecalis TaxID=1598147 RepID=A0ABM6IWM1_9BACL|nr:MULTISPECIES: AAA family ATPase [Planococcus]AQU80916.1 hypothetical protein AJGP001_17185 [Planococcus faecalis]MDJ0333308.1 AAA family ATPase [Planococcus sp. S3-L1]OHX55884.1 hypothetical protein BB777_01760 [Planococcus faecalis]
MIAGLFVNGFKSYSQTSYIHLCKSSTYKFTTIVGKNGTGKSAILEALNFYFKQGFWNANKQSKNKDDMFISPVFLIEKVAFNKWIDHSPEFKSQSSKIKKNLESISRFLWEEANDTFKGAIRRPYIVDFFNQVNNLKRDYQKDYYLLVIGRDVDSKNTSKPMSGYEKELDSISLELINSVIENYYTYIYIPVEQHASSTLKIDNVQMQKIMNQNVILKIEGLLKEKMLVDGKSQSLIDHINNQLSLFVEEINSTVKIVDDTYEFKGQRNRKQNLTAADIVDNILEGYFSKRTLKSSHKELEDLSSGEQRRAMIDVIYAFLKNKGKENESTGRNVILAIDEPEISQDISHCFEQFERLERLSTEYGNQVLVTTHWYGILPVIENGTMLHLSESTSYENKFSIFDFYNYLDNREQFPDEIQLKSMYDLAISLSTYIRKDTSKYLLLCEGGTDKRYLETLLDTKKVRVIPVGGIDNVKNIFSLLVMPLKIDKKSNSIKKVLCLTDTDPNLTNNTDISKDPSGNIQLKRLQINVEKSKVDLVNLDNFNPQAAYKVTRIEDVLSTKIYKKVLENLLNEILEGSDFEGFSHANYSFLEDSLFTNLIGDTQFLHCKRVEATKRKPDFIKFVESKKTRLSYDYVSEFNRAYENEQIEDIPLLFQSIQEFFKDEVLKPIPDIVSSKQTVS